MDDVTRIEKLYKKLGKCKTVEEALSHEGWTDILLPSIESLIDKHSGKKTERGLYSEGSMDTVDPNEAIRALGIRHGMVLVFNLINSFSVEKDNIEAAIKAHDERVAKGEENTMFRSRYNTKGDINV